MCIVSGTVIYVLWVLDRNILQNKMKGIPSYTATIVLVVAMAYPVSDLDDFKVMSTIASVASMSALIIPIMFLYIAKQSIGELRKYSLLISMGMLVYAVAAVIVNENLLNEANRTIFWFFSVIGKTIGLSILSVSSIKFSEE